MIIATGIHRLALNCIEFFNDRRFLRAELLKQRFEMCRELGIICLIHQLFTPIKAEIKMATAIIQLPDFA